MKRALIAALACAMLSVPAEARPKHDRGNPGHARIGPGHQVGCSDPVMRPCVTRHHFVAEHKMVGRYVTARRDLRPRAWCGWWLGRYLGKHDRKLWLARNWAHVGSRSNGPAVGTVVVWARGKRSGHVGIITGKTERGWLVKSGNDGNAVRERVRSVSNAIAFRWP